MTPLIDGILTVAAAIAIASGPTVDTTAYEWEPETREPAVAVAPPAEAPADCATVEVAWVNGSPVIAESVGLGSGLRADIVGSYLWVMVGDPAIATGYAEDYVHAIPIGPGVTSIQVCP